VAAFAPAGNKEALVTDAGSGRRISPIEADLLAALDGVPAGETAEQVRTLIEQGEFELSCAVIQSWLTECGAQISSRALQALARADMAIKIAASRG
jgi:hypothetical protein